MKKSKRGQTMVEYILIVALIAIALIGVFAAFSRGVGKTAAGVTSKLNEEEGDNARDAAENINEDSIRELSEDK